MRINQNVPPIIMKNINSNQNNYFQLSFSNLNNQSRNLNNNLAKDNMSKKYSLYSTKEATPRKEYNNALKSTTIKNAFHNSKKEKNNIYELDDSLSNISLILSTNKKNLNYSELVGKIPGIEDEPNFVYDQILFNKSRIKKAKILSHKIGTLKLPVSNISFKEGLTKSEISDREKKCFSDRSHVNQGINRNKNKTDDVGISCCIFGKKS
jgi:hypothetical protein